MQNIILLHGALGSVSELAPLHQFLQQHFTVHSLNFPGHGGNTTDQPFSLAVLANHVLEFMDDKKISQAHLFGYSMGGFVSIYLAAHHPERILTVTTLGTKFYWDEATARAAKPDPEMIEQKIPAFAQKLATIHHASNWKPLLEKTSAFLLMLGDENPLGDNRYTDLPVPCLFLIGDRDKVASLDETISFYRRQPKAALAVIPFMGHALEKADPRTLSDYIRSFAIQ
ncbi:MAG: alpha/beta fold hydrolase [Ferruginibacter sp.]|nr:alpha/beta fold hydrolase [Ferruginibacter sp.]